MADSNGAHVSDSVREGCAWVADRARFVRVEEGGLANLAAQLKTPLSLAADEPIEGDRETQVAFVLCLDAINFGSGWWPTIRKRPGHSGYFTIAAGLRERFRETGLWSAEALRRLTADEMAAVFDQDPAHPLMADFAAALVDVGAHVADDHGGRFEAVIEAAAGSALRLSDLLAGWSAFADTSTYEGCAVPFFKRAQIAAADIDRTGIAPLADVDRLTAFADNLVPHVLRVDGALRLDPGLEARIEAGELLAHGSPEEVELRACAVHAIELLAQTDHRLCPAEIDALLWTRGRAPRYKSLPRPRSRNTAY